MIKAMLQKVASARVSPDDGRAKLRPEPDQAGGTLATLLAAQVRDSLVIDVGDRLLLHMRERTDARVEGLAHGRRVGAQRSNGRR